jgi:hypothetical protein
MLLIRLVRDSRSPCRLKVLQFELGVQIRQLGSGQRGDDSSVALQHSTVGARGNRFDNYVRMANPRSPPLVLTRHFGAIPGAGCTIDQQKSLKSPPGKVHQLV